MSGLVEMLIEAASSTIRDEVPALTFGAVINSRCYVEWRGVHRKRGDPAT